MNETELKSRTKKFAHDCVKLALELPNNKLGWHLQGQLIRCSTSVAANYRAACVAQSKKSFVSKLGIVVEEADESNFWIEFIKDENLLNGDFIDHLYKESMELTLIFISSRKTAEQSLKSK
ncbi:MAG: four helix bundle protein [Bacteroidales bacterium]|nr:four helix bundle protein [Bacteroidales bacterium]